MKNNENDISEKKKDFSLTKLIFISERSCICCPAALLTAKNEYMNYDLYLTEKLNDS